MKIGIIGGGPAGLYAGYLLAKGEHDVTVFDPKIPFEKPCGGGITSKALDEFEILKELPRISKSVHEFVFISPGERKVSVKCEKPLQIVSREALSHFMLERAKSVGVKLVSEKIKSLEPLNREFDFLIGADGAHGVSRQLFNAKPFLKNRYSGMGYYVRGLSDEQAIVKFYSKRTGYLWVFPRNDHSSVGFFSLSGTFTKELARKTVDDFLKKNYPNAKWSDDDYYSATIPIVWNWNENNVQGNNWVLIGDAGGFTDPITGEGIYYAFKSAEILSQAILDGKPSEYFLRCGEMITELQKSANIFPKFYKTWFTNAMVWMAQHSPYIRDTLVNLILGGQKYTTLKQELKSHIPLVMKQVAISVLFLDKNFYLRFIN